MKHPVIPAGMVPVLAGLVAAGLTCNAAAAQGVELTFGMGLRAESDSNPALTPVGGSESSSLGLNLSFGLISETPTSRLSLDVATGLTSASGPGATGSGLDDPSLILSYAQTTANADFTLDATLTEADLAEPADVTEFETGSGLRRTASLEAALTWGKAAPLGFGLSAGLTDIIYHDNPDPGLIASQTLRLGANARADLSPVLRLDLDLSDSRFPQPGLPDRDTLGLDTGLTLERPAGELALHLVISDTPDGDRSTLRFDQRLDLAAGTLSWSLGATKGVTDTTRLIGSLDYAQDLPSGSLTLGLDRSVGASTLTDAETLQSSVSLDWNHAVTPLANLSLALNWAEQLDTATDLATTNTSLAATWTQSLPRDWAFDMGLTHRLRDEDGVGRGESDSVFLELRRNFSIRY